MTTNHHTDRPPHKNTPISKCLLDQDGKIDYVEAFLDPNEAADLFRQWVTGLHWREEFIRIAGRVVSVPRRVAWYGDAGAIYRYSGNVHVPEPWSPLLLALKIRVEAVCQHSFNSVLGNLYRDGADAIGWHADNERELGRMPYIASLSLGAERRFEIRHNKTFKVTGMPLAPGSLLLMGGDFQAHWKHRLPKQSGVVLPRINLTFRWIHPCADHG